MISINDYIYRRSKDKNEEELCEKINEYKDKPIPLILN